jgi:hypothetical protein
MSVNILQVPDAAQEISGSVKDGKFIDQLSD